MPLSNKPTNEDTSPLSTDIIAPQIASSTSQTPNNRKRCVRFEDDGSNMRRVKRRIVELRDVPTSSDMTHEERCQRWRQHSDCVATLMDVEEVARNCQASNNREAHPSYLHFAESIAMTYNLCYAETDDDDNEDDENIDESNAKRKLPLDQMILLGHCHTPTRGLETKIMPGLGVHRLNKKQEHANCILSLQKNLRATGTNSPDIIAEGLRAVSQSLSSPSKRFARALGVVDGTWALLEYTSTSSATSSVATTVESKPEVVGPTPPFYRSQEQQQLETPTTSMSTIVV